MASQRSRTGRRRGIESVLTGIPMLLAWLGTGTAETLSVGNLAVGCANKTLFRELMTIAKDDFNTFLMKSVDQIDRGNCRWFEKGQKVAIEERDGSILMRVHELGATGSYWTSALFFIPSR